MSYSTYGVGKGEISLSVRSVPKEDWDKLGVTIKAMKHVTSVEFSFDCWARITTNLDELQLSDERFEQKLKKIHDSIEETIEHAATRAKKKVASPV